LGSAKLGRGDRKRGLADHPFHEKLLRFYASEKHDVGGVLYGG
jgi:hypothetical protein